MYNIYPSCNVSINDMDKGNKQNGYAHILKYTGVFGGVQGLSLLVALVRNKCVAVLLGPEGMGIVSLFNATVKLMADATGLGISISAVRNISVAYDEGNARLLRHSIAVIRTWSVVAALLGMLLCAALSPLLSRSTFSVAGHTLDFVWLSPVVGLATLVSGELAILKGMRRLSGLAMITILNVVGALLVTVPIYWWWGADGIVASLLAVAVLQGIFTLKFSSQAFPWRWTARGRVIVRLLRIGGPMVKLGVAFVLASLCGSGADYLIRILLNANGSTADVGLFNAGYMMTITYGSMVFSAMETDYFPRLSACCADLQQMNQTMNQQMEVSLVIISPMLVCFSIGLPVFLPLLFSARFLPVLGMMQISIAALYLRAVKLPISYLPLAKGDSRSFLLMEGGYAVLMVILVTTGFAWRGLTGTGVALLVMSVIDFLVLTFYMHARYGFQISRQVLKYLFVELILGAATIACTQLSGVAYWVVGGALVVASLLTTLYILRNKTNICGSLVKLFGRK